MRQARRVCSRKGYVAPPNPEFLTSESHRYYTNQIEWAVAAADHIIAETATTTITERGATRLDDQTSEAAMEQRKKEGYF